MGKEKDSGHRGYLREHELLKHDIRAILRNHKLTPAEKNLKIYELVRV